MSLTKMDLCNRISRKLGNLPATELKPVVEAFMDEILVALAEGNRIEIRGFGAFKTKNRKKRIGRNPRTGETVPIPEYTAPVFKFSKDAQSIFASKLAPKLIALTTAPKNPRIISIPLKTVEKFQPV